MKSLEVQTTPGTLPASGRERSKSGSWLAYLLMSPVLIYLLAVMAIPFGWAVYLSLTNKVVGVPETFVGLRNYAELLADSVFWKAVWNTLVFTLVAVILKAVFGMIMALVLNENIVARNFFRVMLFLPWTIPTIVSVFTWQWIYSDVGGVLNALLLKTGLIDSPVGWLATPDLAMFSVILVNVWRGIPFMGIAILAGLQTVSKEMYEAAMLDGAGAIKRFFYMTLPSVKEVTILSSVITTIWTLNDFEIIWLLTRGGPDNGTQVLSTLSYTVGFLNMSLGKAIAISVITLPPLIMLINYVTKRSLASDK
ncbi:MULTISPECIES: carbohydrate ABC transporter permease [Paenibacillus]|uniref:Binding-protein-dependent transport systems inner membrane component n=3 Tax=Paenibacillus TaxID=44249 RepID=G4H8H2_9BACL|nr:MULTISPECIES: sugar ABC transporter permease [Paenibacillus]ANY74891.1 sugar ABC transporter [Paenibacillus ihbetae]EHB68157.1 binding-protein-dependent transport systems inner membrane component [Paenibacillus lactis 154]MBP1892096.1 multiple sugar transport system permease protein [Paenibacillus lactis]MCM3492782.1 sugar ABC transporter permease [Paenibacillus lactis]OOC62947.1 sugar ABC transporter [Paenibacillus ihbetae]